MYLLPFVAIFIIALAIFFSPILAVILLIIAVAAIGGVKFFGGGSVVDQENAPADQSGSVAAPPSERPSDESSGHGIWGESWPEQREEHS